MAKAIVALSLVTGACVSQQPPMLGRPVPMSTTLPTPPEPTTTSTTSPTYEQLAQLKPAPPQVAHTRTNTTRPPPIEADWPTGPLPPDYVWRCESGGDYRADNSHGHTGRWQFSDRTWRGVGGKGRAKDASPAEQDYRASVLWDDGRGGRNWSCHRGAAA